MAKVIKAPKGYSYDPYSKFILLAGQFPEKLINEFSGIENLYFLDPTNSTLEWKLTAQSRVDLILFFFKDGDNVSTFLELGVATGMTDSIIVLCQPTFAQLDILKSVCERYNIPIHFQYNDMVDNIKKEIDII